MIKTCFLCHIYEVDAISEKKLQEALTHLMQDDNCFEFWFSGCYEPFQKIAVKQLMMMKELFPEKKIDIVEIVDPFKEEKAKIDFYGKIEGFPTGAVTKRVYAPLMDGKSEKNENFYMIHHRKIVRWIIDQCDKVIAHHYMPLTNSISKDVKNIIKKSPQKIIVVCNPEIEAKILECMDCLEGAPKIIMQGIEDGKSYKAIGDGLGISGERVKQIAVQTSRKIKRNADYPMTEAALNMNDFNAVSSNALEFIDNFLTPEERIESDLRVASIGNLIQAEAGKEI